MLSLFSYMLMIFIVFFWGFRVFVSYAYAASMEFAFQPIDPTMELIVLFAVLPCFALIIKRNLIGATLYVGVYVSYFGTELYNIITQIMAGQVGVVTYSNLAATAVGVILPILVFLDILFNKNMKTSVGSNKKTDWFYKNKDYDREFDERADRNQYKF